MRNRRLIGIVMVLSTSLLTCKFTQVKNDDVPGPGGNPPEGTTFAGTFQGTFTIGRHRVVAAKGSTALIVANLDSKGQSHWMRSFDGLAPGRAVASSPVPGRGLVVAGVFMGQLQFDVPGQKPLDAEGREGLFVAAFGSTGRVTSAKTIASAELFATPTLSLRGDKLIIDVLYKGIGKVGDKSLPEGNGRTMLKLVTSPDGKITSWEILAAGMGGGPPTGPTGAGTGGSPTTGHVARELMTTAASAGACNVCVIDQPLSNPTCTSCKNSVCYGGGNDPFCCLTTWDKICMNEALPLCIDPAAPPTVCNCPHLTGDQGTLMHPSCRQITDGLNWCVTQACVDPFCCKTDWWDYKCTADSQQKCQGSF